MRQTYTIDEEKRQDIEKLIARYQKKALRYGTPLSAAYGQPYAKSIPVYVTDGCVQEKTGEVMVEVFDLTIDGDEIRKDGYSVIAKIEHLEGGNVVSTFGEEVEPAWRTAECRCEHCGTLRDRRLTFIVRGEDGSQKQVGRACLKDYCGIDPQAIGVNNALNAILLGTEVDRYEYSDHPVSNAFDTVDALAFAIRTAKRYGYVRSGEPGSNKTRIDDLFFNNERVSEDERLQAETMARAIAGIDAEEARCANLDNIQSLIRSGYCKRNHFGFIAYAPIAYEKYLKAMRRRAELKAAMDAEREKSDYVGQVGQRIEVAVAEMKLLTSWESQWGMTWLYKFIDVNGNVLVWFASKPMERVNENGVCEDVVSVSRIKATVKEHTTRDSIRQTVVTRCKAL